MCTVTYIPAGDNFFFTSNRDERRGRLPALAPSVYEARTGRLLYPKDAQAGGTWFIVHEKGAVIVLLNGAWTKHIPLPSYRLSRGMILLELAAGESPLFHFQSMELDGVEPFTLVLLEQGQLHECRWDGARKFHRLLDAALPFIWSSVTLYAPEVMERREQWFAGWLRDNPSPDQEAILNFHRFTGDGDPRYDLLMNRDDRMLTVSITSLRYREDEACMTYFDIPAGSSSTRRLSLNRAPVSAVLSSTPPASSFPSQTSRAL